MTKRAIYGPVQVVGHEFVPTTAKKRYAKLVIGQETNGDLTAAVIAANGKNVFNTGDGYTTVAALCKAFKYLDLTEINGVKFKPNVQLTIRQRNYIIRHSYYPG